MASGGPQVLLAGGVAACADVNTGTCTGGSMGIGSGCCAVCGAEQSFNGRPGCGDVCRW
jgi:hypothetical protein